MFLEEKIQKERRKRIVLFITAIIITMIALICINPIQASVIGDQVRNIFEYLFSQLLNAIISLILGVMDLLYEIFINIFVPDFDSGQVTELNNSGGIMSAGTHKVTPNSNNVFGTQSMFFTVFGNIGGFFAVFQRIGLVLCIAIFIIQAYKSLFGPISGGENPYTLALRFVLSVVGIYLATGILTILLTVLRFPYAAILDRATMNTKDLNGVADGGIFTKTHTQLSNNLDRTKDELMGWSTQRSASKQAQNEIGKNTSYNSDVDGGGKNGVTNGLIVWFLSGAVIIIVAKQFLTVILESIERYVLCGVLYIVSPMAFATGTSSETSRYLKGWFQMFITSFLLLGMNVFFMSVAGYGLSVVGTVGSAGMHEQNAAGILKEHGIISNKQMFSIMDANAKNNNANNAILTQFIMLAMIYAMLRIASHADEYMANMGLSVAQTGRGIGMDIIAGAGTLAAGIKGARNSFNGAYSHTFGKGRQPMEDTYYRWKHRNDNNKKPKDDPKSEENNESLNSDTDNKKPSQDQNKNGSNGKNGSGKKNGSNSKKGSGKKNGSNGKNGSGKKNGSNGKNGSGRNRHGSGKRKNNSNKGKAKSSQQKKDNNWNRKNTQGKQVESSSKADTMKAEHNVNDPLANTKGGASHNNSNTSNNSRTDTNQKTTNDASVYIGDHNNGSLAETPPSSKKSSSSDQYTGNNSHGGGTTGSGSHTSRTTVENNNDVASSSGNTGDAASESHSNGWNNANNVNTGSGGDHTYGSNRNHSNTYQHDSTDNDSKDTMADDSSKDRWSSANKPTNMQEYERPVDPKDEAIKRKHVTEVRNL